jgi:hypothetical protein
MACQGGFAAAVGTAYEEKLRIPDDEVDFFQPGGAVGKNVA